MVEYDNMGFLKNFFIISEEVGLDEGVDLPKDYVVGVGVHTEITRCFTNLNDKPCSSISR